jgi:hypothetical protein
VVVVGVFPCGMPRSGSLRSAAVVGAIAAIAAIAAAAVVAIVATRGGGAPAPLGISSRLQSLDAVTRTAPEHLAHPELRLVSVMAPWRALEQADDAFDWRQLEADVEDARDRGYRLILRIMAGRVAPAWLAERGARTLEVYGSDPNAPDHCEPIRVPLPWDPVLEREYEELLVALGDWLRGPDGAGETRADHVAVVPVAMPTVLGSEMTISYGPPGLCPDGTAAAGLDLRAANRAAWDQVAPEAERRSLLETAWRSAVEIHMQALPEATASAIAYGHLFDDRQGAALAIARDLVTRYPERLWSMYTNLQAKLRPDGSLGGWSEVCPRCDEVLRAAINAGGGVGFQLAGTSANDSLEELTVAVEGALEAYPVGFLEAQPGVIDTYRAYLLEGEGSVQSRILEG